jgi:hypothetical protein
MTTDREKIAAERSLLKSQFKGLFDEVEEILFRHDPIGIAFVDSEGVADNPDEYAPEVGTILPRLNTATSTGDVADIVHAEFCRWFDGDETAGPKENYEAASEEIWTAWKRFSDAHRT